MAIKPVYECAPLLRAERAALHMAQSGFEQPARARVAAWIAQALPEAIPALNSLSADEIRLLEAAIRMGGEPGRAALEALRRTDAATLTALPPEAGLAAAQAALLAYAETGERGFLALVGDWLAAAPLGQMPHETSAAEWLGLLVTYYRFSGKEAALTIAAQARQACYDWVSFLRTADFGRAQQTFAAEDIADGMRFAIYAGILTGNGTALTAPKRAWEEIQKNQGMACGGTSGAPLFAGASPWEAQTTKTLCAWVDALSLVAVTTGERWAAEAVERMAVNALRAVLSRESLPGAIAVNDGKQAAARFPEAQADGRTLWRLARAVSACAETATVMTPDGLETLRLAEGSCTAPVGDGAVRLTWTRTEPEPGVDCWTAELRTRGTEDITLTVNVPAWAAEATLTLPDGAMEDAMPGLPTVLRRRFESGDTLTLTLRRSLRCEQGYHRALAVLDGATLLGAAEGEAAHCAIVGEPVRNGEQVTLPVAEIAEQGKKNQMPVLPVTSGTPRPSHLRAWAKTPDTLGMLPGGRHR